MKAFAESTLAAVEKDARALARVLDEALAADMSTEEGRSFHWNRIGRAADLSRRIREGIDAVHKLETEAA